ILAGEGSLEREELAVGLCHGGSCDREDLSLEAGALRVPGGGQGCPTALWQARKVLYVIKCRCARDAGHPVLIRSVRESCSTRAAAAASQVVLRTASRPVANRRQLSISTPRARLPAAVSE